MPNYTIEQYEIWTQTYKVEADSEAEAVKAVLEGDAAAIDGGHDYIEICQDLGLPVDEYRDLAEALHDLDVNVDEDVIPSIRSVEQVD